MRAGAMDTAILMADTGSPDFARSNAAGTPYMKYVSLTAWLNAQYARRHGYRFLFFQYVEHGCAHVIWGMRHPSYCKLAAIAAALKRHTTVVFIDSDSFFSPAAPSLPKLIASHQHGRWPSDGAPDVLFASDRPFTVGPNCGCASSAEPSAKAAPLRDCLRAFPLGL